MNWLKLRLRQWLGINADIVNWNNQRNTDIEQRAEQSKQLTRAMSVLSAQISKQVEIGVDLDPRFGDQSYVVIVSRMNGGQVRIVPVRFKGLREMHEYCTHLKDAFGSEANVTIDTPAGAFRDHVTESARGLRRSSIWD